MRLIDELRAEHDRIDVTLGSLRTYIARRVRGEADRADAARFLTFFRLYADRFHHAREEQVLFPTLGREAGVPVETGPIASLGGDHVRMRAMLGELAGLLEKDALTRLEPLTVTYSRALWLHIDAENSVFFPEALLRLGRSCVYELPSRPPTDDEARARDDAEALVLRYPPFVDRELVRGEGCAVCPSFGVSCDGVEREWWTEEEWDEFPDRVG
jgi:hemerythrin-like domain-containing protein